MEFQIPRIVHEEVEDNRGVFVIEPLDRGFGYTFGNSLRRVLLSSLEGAAVTSVKIEGVAHEFTTLPGVREDVTDILLNFKNLICRLHGESPEIEVRLTKKGAGVVKASDIEAPAELEILNPELEIANLSEKGKLEVTLTIGRGRGYVPAELNRGPEHTIGVIPIDSIFSPVRRVSYDVEAARVGQRTDYDKLRLDISTDGSLDPKDALAQAAEILGLAAKRPVRAGQPLRAADLMKPEVVKKNDIVMMRYEIPGIVLTLRGQALDNGTEGDVVNVLNIQSKRTIQGTVTGPGQVTMLAPNTGRLAAVAATE
jgi:DNA-directed RNA polymerase alpha subunit